MSPRSSLFSLREGTQTGPERAGKIQLIFTGYFRLIQTGMQVRLVTHSWVKEGRTSHYHIITMTLSNQSWKRSSLDIHIDGNHQRRKGGVVVSYECTRIWSQIEMVGGFVEGNLCPLCIKTNKDEAKSQSYVPLFASPRITWRKSWSYKTQNKLIFSVHRRKSSADCISYFSQFLMCSLAVNCMFLSQSTAGASEFCF